jgi:aryl-alcohol dehydrogenase-like predicted oxidoreductase
MKLKPFGSLPVQVSEIGFGTSQLANTDNQFDGVKYISTSDARSILQKAVDHGINIFDTSPTYGTAEKLVGEIKSKHKDKIIVASKAGLKPDGTRDFSESFLRHEIERSLKELQVECLDIFQLNKPSKSDLENADVFGFLDKLKKQGKIKYSGVIVGDIEAGFQCIESGKVDCLQIFYNLLCQEAESLITKAHVSGLGVLARSPLNSGLLTGAYNKDTVFESNDARSTFFKGDEFTQRLEILNKIQKDLDICSDQLMGYSMRFILSHQGRIVAIPATSKVSQIDELAKFANNLPRFDSGELDSIKEIIEKYMGKAGFAQQL